DRDADERAAVRLRRGVRDVALFLVETGGVLLEDDLAILHDHHPLGLPRAAEEVVLERGEIVRGARVRRRAAGVRRRAAVVRGRRRGARFRRRARDWEGAERREREREEQEGAFHARTLPTNRAALQANFFGQYG